MVASGVLIAALQRATDDDGLPRFLVKGGTYLELRLGLKARATRDVDTMFRGAIEELVEVLDCALAEPFDGIIFRRSEPKEIPARGRAIHPVRFDLRLQLRGRTWRRIPLEVSAEEGRAGECADFVQAPSLAHFGLTVLPTTAGIVADYQVAQKLHACTEEHTEGRPNDRARDVVDLLLLNKAFYEDSNDQAGLAAACRDVFQCRAQGAGPSSESPPRQWPPIVHAYAHWRADYERYAAEVQLGRSLEDAVRQLNHWIAELDALG
ncbi:MAG: nucleotidyl transferase AbiEii/AbiGii toxin family protein [bacterium]